MGVWGPGNFERDDALNVLGWWYQNLVDDIRQTFNRDHQQTLYEDYGESRIVANIDILIILVEHYESYPNLQPDEVMQWKQNYLESFERTIHSYIPASGFVEERRKIIETTFDKLKTITEQMFDE